MIDWCFKQKKGIKIVEPNRRLSESYLTKADNALNSIECNKFKEWKLATAYYSMYFSVYAILTKIGIKCEIHQCTIEFTRKYLSEFFNESDIDLLQIALKSRIDEQYYIDKEVNEESFTLILENAPRFNDKCSEILLKLNESKISQLRQNLQKQAL